MEKDSERRKEIDGIIDVDNGKGGNQGADMDEERMRALKEQRIDGENKMEENDMKSDENREIDRKNILGDGINEDVKREEPKQEEIKPEEPKQEEIKPEEPKQEEPKQEEIKPEEPKQEEPKQEGIKPEEPKQEEIKPEEPKQEEPKQEEIKPEEPKQEGIKPEEPKQEDIKPEEPKQEEPKQEEIKPEEPKQEEIKPEEPKQNDVKPEEPKQEDVKPEEPKQEEPKQEEIKPEEPKQEEIKPEEPKQEEIKPEEQLVTVQPAISSSRPIGRPTWLLTPTMVALRPRTGWSVWPSSVVMPRGVHGRRPNSRRARWPTFSGWKPSTSFFGSISDRQRWASSPDGRGSCRSRPSMSSLPLSSVMSFSSGHWPTPASSRQTRETMPTSSQSRSLLRT